MVINSVTLQDVPTIPQHEKSASQTKIDAMAKIIYNLQLINKKEKEAHEQTKYENMIIQSEKNTLVERAKIIKPRRTLCKFLSDAFCCSKKNKIRRQYQEDQKCSLASLANRSDIELKFKGDASFENVREVIVL